MESVRGADYAVPKSGAEEKIARDENESGTYVVSSSRRLSHRDAVARENLHRSSLITTDPRRSHEKRPQPNDHAEERDYEIYDFLRGGRRESVILGSALSTEDDRDSHSDES